MIDTSNCATAGLGLAGPTGGVFPGPTGHVEVVLPRPQVGVAVGVPVGFLRPLVVEARGGHGRSEAAQADHP